MSALREKTSNNTSNLVLQPILCCSIIENMQKDVLLLQREIVKLAPLEEQYREHLKEFLQLTQMVDSKLYALWTTGPLFESTKGAKAKEFVQAVTSVWRSGDEEIRKTLKNTQLVSQNYPDVSLEEFLHIVKAHFTGLKKQVNFVPRHIRCNHIAYSKHNEVVHLLSHLSHMDHTLQHYIALGRANPFLRNIGNVIDQFIIQEGFLRAIYGTSFAETVQPGKSSWKTTLPGPNSLSTQNTESPAHQSLAKLLTGELLGQEPLDPHSGLDPMVKDSKLEIYIVPSESVKTRDNSSIWKSLFDIHQTGAVRNITPVKISDVPDSNTALNYSKGALSGKENIGTIEKVIHTIKLPYKVPNPNWKNKKQKFREVIGASVDTDLQPIKIPRIEGALLPPLH